MTDFADLNQISSCVSVISLKFPTSQCEEYKRTMDATEHILAARDAADDQTRDDHLSTAIDAIEAARPEVPEELVDEWDECRDALDEAMADE